MQPFQKRVVDERFELTEKLDALRNFFSGELIKALPAAEQDRLKLQAVFMTGYLEALAQRIAAFSA